LPADQLQQTPQHSGDTRRGSNDHSAIGSTTPEGGEASRTFRGGGRNPISTTPDFNDDAFADILWRGTSSNVAVWLMNGATPSQSAGLDLAPTTWTS